MLLSETEYTDKDLILAFLAGEVLDFSSVRFHGSASTDPTYELPVNNEDLIENANLMLLLLERYIQQGLVLKFPRVRVQKAKKENFYRISSLSKG